MRSILKMATFILVLLTANNAFANTGKPLFKIKDSGEKTFYLETFEMSSTFVEVKIQDENGKTLFAEYAIHTANFERKYNLSELVNGTYYLVVKSDTTTQLLPISITETGLEIEFEDLETM